MFNLEENIFASPEKNDGVKLEKEKIEIELRKVDAVREIVIRKYSQYEMIRNFVDHLASTEKVFLLAGMKKDGDKVFKMFVESESEVMAQETGIDKEIFNDIKEEFLKIKETVDAIEDASGELKEKYSDNSDFVDEIRKSLIQILELSDKMKGGGFDLNREKEKIILEMIESKSAGDAEKKDKLMEIYSEFKSELEK